MQSNAWRQILQNQSKGPFACGQSVAVRCTDLTPFSTIEGQGGSIPGFGSLVQEPEQVHDLPYRKQGAHPGCHGSVQLHERVSQQRVQFSVESHILLDASGSSFVPEGMILKGPPSVVEMLPAEGSEGQYVIVVKDNLFAEHDSAVLVEPSITEFSVFRSDSESLIESARTSKQIGPKGHIVGGQESCRQRGGVVEPIRRIQDDLTRDGVGIPNKSGQRPTADEASRMQSRAMSHTCQPVGRGNTIVIDEDQNLST
jgi:hypothetical protein